MNNEFKKLLDNATIEILLSPKIELFKNICEIIDINSNKLEENINLIKKKLFNKYPKTQILTIDLIEYLIYGASKEVVIKLDSKEFLKNLLLMYTMAKIKNIKDKIINLILSVSSTKPNLSGYLFLKKLFIKKGYINGKEEFLNNFSHLKNTVSDNNANISNDLNPNERKIYNDLNVLENRIINYNKNIDNQNSKETFVKIINIKPKIKNLSNNEKYLSIEIKSYLRKIINMIDKLEKENIFDNNSNNINNKYKEKIFNNNININNSTKTTNNDSKAMFNDFFNNFSEKNDEKLKEKLDLNDNFNFDDFNNENNDNQIFVEEDNNNKLNQSPKNNNYQNFDKTKNNEDIFNDINNNENHFDFDNFGIKIENQTQNKKNNINNNKNLNKNTSNNINILDMENSTNYNNANNANNSNNTNNANNSNNGVNYINLTQAKVNNNKSKNLIYYDKQENNSSYNAFDNLKF